MDGGITTCVESYLPVTIMKNWSDFSWIELLLTHVMKITWHLNSPWYLNLTWHYNKVQLRSNASPYFLFWYSSKFRFPLLFFWYRDSPHTSGVWRKCPVVEDSLFPTIFLSTIVFGLHSLHSCSRARILCRGIVCFFFFFCLYLHMCKSKTDYRFVVSASPFICHFIGSHSLQPSTDLKTNLEGRFLWIRRSCIFNFILK